MADMTHAWVTWSPNPKKDPDFPRGIGLWAEILERDVRAGKSPYCWWGKVSVTGNLGMDDSDVNMLNDQISRERMSHGCETHLYIYSGDPKLWAPSLHVGLVEEVRGKDDGLRNDIHSPNFFARIRFPVPFWFKLTDLRVLPVKQIDNLTFQSGKEFDPNDNVAVPCLMLEKYQRTWFAKEKLRESRWNHWWHEILYGGPQNFAPIRKMISIEEGEIYNFKNLFGDYLKTAQEIKVIDPYIRNTSQTENVIDLLGLVKQPQETRVKLVTMYDVGREAECRELLDRLRTELVATGFDFEWEFDPSIHDRLIETERWEIYLGRGLDFISNGRTKKCNVFFVQR